MQQLKVNKNLNFDDDSRDKNPNTLNQIPQHVYESRAHVDVYFLLAVVVTSVITVVVVAVTVFAAQTSVGVPVSALL